MAKDPYRFFRIEAHEIVDGLGRDLLALETSADPKLVARLLRLAHTLKGAARIVKHRELAELAHVLEDELAPLRTAPAPQRLDRALVIVDQMSAAVRALPPPAAADPMAASPSPPGAIAIPRTKTRPEAAEPRAASAALDDVLAQLADVHERVHRLRAEVPREASAAIDALDHELGAARHDAERLRFLPASALFTSLARTARDAAVATGKRVVFAGEGGDVRLDADVLGMLQVALVQLVRNAVVHGIRASAEGRVVVRFELRGARAVATCSDDGAGIDLEAVRAAAGAPATASDAELVELVLRGGLTTAREISELAGRGIGLDVVRDAAVQLGGEIAARTVRGRGTTFTLDVPIARTAVSVIVAATHERSVAVPIHAVRRVVRIHTPDLVPRDGGGYAIPFDDMLVPVGALSVVLGFKFFSRSGSGAAIIMADEDGTLGALSAERVIGIEDAIVHVPSAGMRVDPIVRGFAVDASGLPRPVLDPGALIALIHRGRVAPPGPAPQPLPILVVDDSLTSRMVEQSMLESAGYEVELASSAEEGLLKIAHRAYGLVLVDVEMPGMDGFGFIATLRAQPAFAALPAILVTSRDAPEDRRRGRDAGAQGYVVKAELDQAELIEMIRELVRA